MRHSKKTKDQAQRDEAIEDKMQVENESEMPTILQVGTVVACFLDKYKDEEPQLGVITGMHDESFVEVNWMTGSYSEPWAPCKTRKGRDYVPWLEKIPTNLVLFPITLTRAKRISTIDKDKLKDAYDNIQ